MQLKPTSPHSGATPFEQPVHSDKPKPVQLEQRSEKQVLQEFRMHQGHSEGQLGQETS